jgi:hypothetical protein
MSKSLRTKSTVERAQWVMTQLVQDPVKEAVREALQEEAATVEREKRERKQSDSQQSDEDSGGSKLAMVVGLVAVVGIAYAVKQRRSGGDSDQHSGTGQSHTQPSHQSSQEDRSEEEPPVTGDS